MSLVSKEFGTLSFKVCRTTSFICAKNILENYNETTTNPETNEVSMLITTFEKKLNFYFLIFRSY
jgi:hypothetical protein